MRDEAHLDPDLFDLFLTSGVYREYAERFMEPDNVDDVDVQVHLSAAARASKPFAETRGQVLT